MKSVILCEFRKLKCIADWSALEMYVDFCISNDIGNHKPGVSSAHHILPAAKNLPFTVVEQKDATSLA